MEVQWVVRQTGFGQRSWAYDPSKVHEVEGFDWQAVKPNVTRCGLTVPWGDRMVHPTPRDPRCKRCFR